MHDVAFWAFQAVGAICLFVIFLPASMYFSSRQKERESYYKSETMRRITESSSDGAKSAIELLREENRMKLVRMREGLKIGGLVTTGVGIGLSAFLWSVGRNFSFSPWLVGMIPFFVGVAMLVYVFFLAAPIDDGPRN